jgi:acetyltransferase-like isoleucine patch superfamily enzyme
MNAEELKPGHWTEGELPTNARIGANSVLTGDYAFRRFFSERSLALVIGDHCAMDGVHFALGKEARVEIGDYSLLSWNVVLMDSYRLSLDPNERRRELEAAARREPRLPMSLDGNAIPARPIRIGKNVWIGFDSCVLPGVTIGDGVIVGARSVVVEDVEPYTVVAGNPARLIRRLEAATGNERRIL